MGNLTFDEDLSLHNVDPNVQNDYRDILKMIANSYANVTNLAIFGYGAKTLSTQKKSTPMFPLTRNIRNPFTPNHPEMIDEMYTNCLKSLEMSVPIKVSPVVQFFKSLGQHVQKKLANKARTITAIRNTIDSFYVLYVLTTGLMDDVAQITECL